MFISSFLQSFTGGPDHDVSCELNEGIIIIFFGQVACGILVPRPGIEPAPPALEVWSLNRRTTGEVPKQRYYVS